MRLVAPDYQARPFFPSLLWGTDGGQRSRHFPLVPWNVTAAPDVCVSGVVGCVLCARSLVVCVQEKLRGAIEHGAHLILLPTANVDHEGHLISYEASGVDKVLVDFVVPENLHILACETIVDALDLIVSANGIGEPVSSPAYYRLAISLI